MLNAGARKERMLSPEFLERRWKPGESGNPAGHSGEYGEVLRMARALAPRAIERLSELLESEDERVAAVACNALLDRAFGKPREHPPQPSPVSELSDAELDEALVGHLVNLGLSERKARALLRNSPSRVGIIPRRSSK
jgi:hypothetical protein